MGGGGPKLRTGIKALDNTVNNAAGAASLGLVGNGVDQVGKNLEAAGQGAIKNAVGIFQPGGLNNLGNTYSQNALQMLTGGSMTQEDLKDVAGESGMQRKEREMTQEAIDAETAAAAADVAARTEETLRTIQSTISGAVTSKKMNPGRKATQSFLTGGGASQTNNLLKIAGNA